MWYNDFVKTSWGDVLKAAPLPVRSHGLVIDGLGGMIVQARHSFFVV